MRCLCWIAMLILSGVHAAAAADMTVAVVRGNSLLPYDDVLAGFKAGISEKNMSVDIVTLDARIGRKQLDARVAAVRPDLILCLDAKALEQASSIENIPKSFSMITSANLEPWSGRRDISGVFLDIDFAAQFKILRQAFPEAGRIGVLYDPKHNGKIVEDAKRAAATAGLNLRVFPVDTIQELPFALENLEGNADLLLALYDPTVYSPESARYILMQLLQRRIPVVGFSPHFARAGAVLAIYGDYYDMGKQAARQALALRDGVEDAGSLNRPRTVKIAVNEKVAKFFGMTFSPSFRKMVNQSF
jgi:ABC-type uncharacterized transport system substrate-binding protein